MKLLAPDSDITFVPSEDGGGWGVAVVTAVASRLALHRSQLEKTLTPFRLDKELLKAVQAQMREAMERGLRGEDSSLPMLPTYVCSTPDGTGECASWHWGECWPPRTQGMGAQKGAVGISHLIPTS